MHYLILDLEATCWENDRSRQNEIIEIGAVKLDEKLLMVSEFQTFIRPIIHPILSDFCKQLTSIEQKDVDNAPSFEEAIANFKNWIDANYIRYLLIGSVIIVASNISMEK